MGCLLGIGLTAALLLTSRPAEGGAAAGANVSFGINLTGELGVSPAMPKPFLDDRDMHPAELPATGSFEVTNQTGERLALRPRALSSDPALDGLLEVSLRSGHDVLANGLLGNLRKPSGPALTLDPGQSAKLEASASLPESVDPAVAAASLVEISISFARKDLGPAP